MNKLLIFHRLLLNSHAKSWASQVVLAVKNSPANAGDRRDEG